MFFIYKTCTQFWNIKIKKKATGGKSITVKNINAMKWSFTENKVYKWLDRACN
jgi:hypothetical protein